MLWQMGIYNNFVANGYVMWFKQMWYLVIVWLCEKCKKLITPKKCRSWKLSENACDCDVIK